MLSVAPGREDDWRYWRAALSANAMVMRLIDNDSPADDDYAHLRRPLPRALLAACRARRAAGQPAACCEPTLRTSPARS